jgi:predicted PurR-regulated permease PerM
MNEKKNEHIFERNRKYYTISIYTIITVLIIALLLKVIWNWSSTIDTFSKILDVLSPFLIGIFIAYLMNPLVKLLNRSFFQKLLKIKNSSVRKALSIFVSYIIVFGIIGICISVIIPELYSSLKNLYANVQDYYDKLINFLDKLNEKHPDWDISYITTVVKDNSSDIIDFVRGSLDKVLPLLYNTSISVISWIFNIIIAIIVSCYLLIDKNRLLLNCRRLMYAVLKKERADRLSDTLSSCNKIFGNFIIGKTIDSTIIGFMCFIFMKILGLKYSMLISVIVGITNMIPYIGPFIGAVPGVVILLTVHWKYALIFGVLILVLQQFDGLYLGPKILGESTGLRPVWILFAITVGGWLCGPVGMFLGVPCVAVIAFLVERAITKQLDKKNIDVETLKIDNEC